MPSSDLSAAELVESGKRELQNQNFKVAVDSLTKAIELDPALFEAFYYRALGKLQLSQIGYEQREFGGVLDMRTSAFDDVSECIRLNPAYENAYLLRSNLFMGFNFQFEKAIQDLRTALQLVPDSVSTLLNLAGIFCHPMAPDYSQALELVHRASAIDPSNEDVIRMLLKLHQIFGNTKEAIEDLGLLIAKDPTNAKLYCDRAELREQVQDCEGAMADLELACQISEEWLTFRSEFHLMHQRFDLAEADLLRAVETSDPDFRHFPHKRLAALYVGLERFDKALEQLNLLFEIGPVSMLTHYFSTRSFIYLKLGESDKALEDCNQVLSLIEKDGQRWGTENNLTYQRDKALALIKRAEVYAHKQARSAAQNDFDAAYELLSSPKDYEGIGKLAETTMSTGDYQTSVHIFSEIIEAIPDCDRAYFQRGIANEKLEREDNAISDFSKCIQLRPLHSKALSARAELYEKRGQNDLAAIDRKALSESMQIHFVPEEFDYWRLFFGTPMQGT